MRPVFLLLVLCAACKPATDLGNPCVLVAAHADGGRRVLSNRELDGTKDFISLGSLDCEDLICVRTARADDAGVPDPDEVATGHCSTGCELSSSCPASMTCRPLLVDGNFCVLKTTSNER